tara:strand:- start:8012 stop:8593 length:582 start_codon:yes stop_codon:yes gene_type:complete
MDNRKFEHLLRNIPNNFLTRYIIDLINKKMIKSSSKYCLFKRYRKPIKGFKYDDRGGLIPINNLSSTKNIPTYKRGKTISIYLRKRNIKENKISYVSRENINIKSSNNCYECKEDVYINIEDYHINKYDKLICSDCGIKSHCFCSDCGAYVPTSEINCIDNTELILDIEIDENKTLCFDCNTSYEKIIESGTK